MKLLLLMLSAVALLAQSRDASPRRANLQTTLPATCNVGEQVFKTDAAAGQNLYGCTATNTWTQLGGAAGFAQMRTSGTVLDVTAGKAGIGSTRTAYSAATLTLSGTSASSTVYVYISEAGIYTCGHNGATTLTSAVCTVATGVTAFPLRSVPIFKATYTSGAWDVSGITDERPVVSRDIIRCGEGLSCAQDAAGVLDMAATTTTPSYAPYFPFGHTVANGGSLTTVFTANQTRWVRVQLPAMTTTGIRIASNVAIGGGAGIRWALADSTGTILVKTVVNTTCGGTSGGNDSLCQAAWSAPYTNTAGNYYVGVTTDSTVWQQFQMAFILPNAAFCKEANIGTAPIISGTGTVGSGTGASVDFGASMGSLIAFVCNFSTNTVITGTHNFWFY